VKLSMWFQIMKKAWSFSCFRYGKKGVIAKMYADCQHGGGSNVDNKNMFILITPQLWQHLFITHNNALGRLPALIVSIGCHVLAIVHFTLRKLFLKKYFMKKKQVLWFYYKFTAPCVKMCTLKSKYRNKQTKTHIHTDIDTQTKQIICQMDNLDALFN